MRITNVIPAVVILGVWACADAPRPEITNPDTAPQIRYDAVPNACDADVNAAVNAQIDRLFTLPDDNTTAHIHWGRVTAACLSDNAAARELMIFHVGRTIEPFRSGRVANPSVGTAADSILNHWNLAFQYVGYSPPNLTSDVFGPEGAVDVIQNLGGANGIAGVGGVGGLIPGGLQELRAANAALTMYNQDGDGDPRGHLFTIAPIAGGCLSGTNLTQNGPCFEFSSFPKVSPQFSPAVKVGICQPVARDGALPGISPALGHLNGLDVEVPPQSTYPTFCAHTDEVAFHPGISGMLQRVAWYAKRAITPTLLYAVHGGLGGTGSTLSPFGGVDLTVFQAGTYNPSGPQAGSWTTAVTRPGKIYNQLNFGNYVGLMTVLDQGGGNCAKCGGVLLQANLSSAVNSGATSGRYRISWVSLEDKPTVKNAPFIIRGTGGEIGRLEYRSLQSSKFLYYNGVLIGSWAQHVPQRFVITVDLNQKKTGIWIGEVGATLNQPDATIPFLSNTNMTQLAADFSEQDSGLMGWAEVSVQRLVDN